METQKSYKQSFLFVLASLFWGCIFIFVLFELIYLGTFANRRPDLGIQGVFILVAFIVSMLHIFSTLWAYSFTELTLDENSVTFRQGFFSRNYHDIRFSKINSIGIKKGFFGTIFNYGDIVLYSGNDVSGIAFRAVNDPTSVRDEIDKRIEKFEHKKA